MQLGMIGAGLMGANMVHRLLRRGHDCVVYARDAESLVPLVADGATGAGSLAELVAQLKPPRAVWIMVPAPAVGEVLAGLTPLLAPGDCVIDGGNSPFELAIERAAELGSRQVEFLDVGTSGGVWGRERGYCLMVGGSSTAVDRLRPVLRDLAPGSASVAPPAGRSTSDTATEGWLHAGPAGAGHFLKMVHNGIEYGIMAAYAEGFNLLRQAGKGLTEPALENADRYRYAFDPAAVAELWRRGSVISSWLLDLTAAALAADPGLEGYQGHVSDSGEGRWTIKAAIDTAVPVPVLSAALYARFSSRGEADYADRLLSAMRFQFGGHREPGG